MKLKLSDREKILLTIAAVCLIAALLYYVVILPQLNMVNRLEKQAKQYSMVIKDIKEKASLNNPVYSDYKLVNAKNQDLLRKYYPSIIQEEIILILDKNLKQSNLTVKRIVFLEPGKSNAKVEKTEQAPLQPDELKALAQQIINGVKTEQAKAKDDKPKPEQQVPAEKMSLSIEFEGTYRQLYHFISSMEQERRSIACSELNVESKDSDLLTGDIVLDFYALPKPFIQEGDRDYLDWDINRSYGKINPFGYAPSAGTVGGINIDPTKIGPLDNSIHLEKVDFFASVRPISSDLPTITIGKYEDNSRGTYLYADNTGYEKVQLQVKEEAGRYFYRYSTQNDSFPSGSTQDMMEFKPAGDQLQLLVISSSRNKEKDMNGVSLSISNKTSLPLQIIVQGDDSRLPRFKLDKTEGMVSVQNR